jgi:hypothetical protein
MLTKPNSGVGTCHEGTLTLIALSGIMPPYPKTGGPHDATRPIAHFANAPLFPRLPAFFVVARPLSWHEERQLGLARACAFATLPLTRFAALSLFVVLPV